MQLPGSGVQPSSTSTFEMFCSLKSLVSANARLGGVIVITREHDGSHGVDLSFVRNLSGKQILGS